MTCTDAARSTRHYVLSRWLARLIEASTPRRRHPLLDIRTLPDHLKRDMGILDGKDPLGRHR